MLLFKVPRQAAAIAGPAGQQGGGGSRAGDGDQGCTMVLHTGDFRWHPGMAEHPALQGVQVGAAVELLSTV